MPGKINQLAARKKRVPSFLFARTGVFSQRAAAFFGAPNVTRRQPTQPQTRNPPLSPRPCPSVSSSSMIATLINSSSPHSAACLRRSIVMRYSKCSTSIRTTSYARCTTRRVTPGTTSRHRSSFWIATTTTRSTFSIRSRSHPMRPVNSSRTSGINTPERRAAGVRCLPASAFFLARCKQR